MILTWFTLQCPHCGPGIAGSGGVYGFALDSDECTPKDIDNAWRKTIDGGYNEGAMFKFEMAGLFRQGNASDTVHPSCIHYKKRDKQKTQYAAHPTTLNGVSVFFREDLLIQYLEEHAAAHQLKAISVLTHQTYGHLQKLKEYLETNPCITVEDDMNSPQLVRDIRRQLDGIRLRNKIMWTDKKSGSPSDDSLPAASMVHHQPSLSDTHEKLGQPPAHQQDSEQVQVIAPPPGLEPTSGRSPWQERFTGTRVSTLQGICTLE